MYDVIIFISFYFQFIAAVYMQIASVWISVRQDYDMCLCSLLFFDHQ